MQIYNSSTYVNEYVYLGIIEEVSKERGARIEQKNKFCTGDEIEIMKPDGQNIAVRVLSLTTQEGEEVESAPHPRQALWVKLSRPGEKFDLLRVKKKTQ